MKPILFNGEMVRAVRDRRKTVTRRVIKSPHSPYSPGDILYVRETWCEYGELGAAGQVIPGTEKYYYRADGENPMPFNFFLVQHSGWDEHRETPVWRPSIHMPKEAARIFLLVKDVWEERLQDISYDDCLHEGIAYEDIAERDVLHQTDSARCLFAELWNSTIRPKDRDRYGWDANPGVRVIEFEVISREDAE